MGKDSAKSELCVCGSGNAGYQCCEPVLAGSQDADTAVALMRSRYAAFATGNHAYLLATWHPRTRPSDLQLDPQQRWLELKIKRQIAGQASDDTGQVEFVARFKLGSRGYALRELSSFERVDGRWVYVVGTVVGTVAGTVPGEHGQP